MSRNDIVGQLPDHLREGPRAYLVAGVLGIALFAGAGLLWGDEGFLASMLLELGGGAFIVFLLEFLLPRALRYADDGTWGVALRRVGIVWSDEAMESLIGFDDDEVRELLRTCRRPGFPDKSKASVGVFDTGKTFDEHPVLSKQVGADFLLFYYAEKVGRLRRKSAFVVDLVPSVHRRDGTQVPARGDRCVPACSRWLAPVSRTRPLDRPSQGQPAAAPPRT